MERPSLHLLHRYLHHHTKHIDDCGERETDMAAVAAADGGGCYCVGNKDSYRFDCC